jgi:deoxycytidine triphosphate deaminase
MSLLTDSDLTKMICATKQEWQQRDENNPKIYINPFAPDNLKAGGYDLRVGTRYASALKGRFQVNENAPVTIEPGDTVLITTLEEIKMPINKKLSAFILSKVSQVSKGLSHISTTVDPDWEGKLLIAVTNHSRKKVELKLGESFCTMVFLQNQSAATKESAYEPGREDILISQFSNTALELQREIEKKRIAKRRIFIAQILVSISIIPLFLGIGYHFFKNDPGLFITVAGLGATLSQTALALISNIKDKEN